MNSRLYMTIAALTLLGLSACGGGPSGGNAPGPVGGGGNTPPAPLEPGLLGDGRIGELVANVRERHNVPALGAIVVANGVIVESAVHGLRSIDGNAPVTESDKWHIGSLTKAMTATLAGIVVEQGLLSWDTTPLDTWPEAATTMHDGYRNVTLAQLLAHQAGIQPDQDSIPSIALVRDEAPGTIEEKRQLWAKELLQLVPANAAGEFNYANGGYIVAGAMLEKVSGMSWEALMDSYVFAPLGMLNSGFGAPGSAGQLDQPWGHQVHGGQLVAIPPGADADNAQAIGPAGTVHTTLRDYALFMFAHLEGELGVPGLVSADTYRFLHTAVGGADYALGWQVDDTQGWANGPLLFHLGSNLRWVANAGIVPGLDTGIFIVTNTANQDGFDASDEMAQVLLTRILASQ